MRVSDTDRERVLDELRRHCAAGRLDMDEYALRVEEALAASNLAGLDHARRDLPLLRIADPVERPRRAAAWATARATARNRQAPGAVGGLATPLLAALSVLMVALATVLAVFAHVVWGLLLLGGWVVGLFQGRLVRRR
ncbi:MAG: DUF1707 SHOCT-like domain-containing protein [Acidimicrobiales bacterium]